MNEMLKDQIGYLPLDKITPGRLMALYIHVLLTSGARRGEIAGLKWDKVDFFNYQIEIFNNLLYDSTHGIYETTPKTEGSIRFVKLPEETMEMLKAWRKKCNQLETNYVISF